MSSAIAKLAALGGPPLGGSLGAVASDIVAPSSLEELGLVKLLRQRNGFYAFEQALHVFPLVSTRDEQGLEAWNSKSSWREGYQDFAEGCLFFAEDVFGGQFCLRDRCVMAFDPETGEKTLVAADVEHWAQCILDEHDVLTGYPLAHAWQERYGVIPLGQRLVPKVPFVLGGDFTVNNLFLLESGRAMRSRANLAVQIRDMADGTEVKFRIVD
jgi:hypothetical protein